MRQQQRAVQGFGETDGAQEMIGLVAETAHTRAVGDVARRRVAGQRKTQKIHAEKQQRSGHDCRREERLDRGQRRTGAMRLKATVQNGRWKSWRENFEKKASDNVRDCGCRDYSVQVWPAVSAAVFVPSGWSAWSWSSMAPPP